MTTEERLLRAIFDEKETADGVVDIIGDEDDSDDDAPETHADKASYAEFILQQSLEYISPALRRLSRINRLFAAMRKEDGTSNLPDIITNNECRVALQYLSKVKCRVDEAHAEIVAIYQETKGAYGNV